MQAKFTVFAFGHQEGESLWKQNVRKTEKSKKKGNLKEKLIKRGKKKRMNRKKIKEAKQVLLRNKTPL